MERIPTVTRCRSSNNFTTLSSLVSDSSHSVLGCLNHDNLDTFQQQLFESLQNATDYNIHNFFHKNASILYKFIITLYITSLDQSNTERSNNKKEQLLLDTFQKELGSISQSTTYDDDEYKQIILPKENITPKLIPPPVPIDAFPKKKCIQPPPPPPLHSQRSKPRDYDEIKIKAVNPLNYKRGLGKNGKFCRNTKKQNHEPSLLPQRSIKFHSNEVPNESKRASPKKPKKKKATFECEGILKVIPKHTKIMDVNGWIFCRLGMISVPYKENIKQIESNNIMIGSTVFFECVNNTNYKFGINIRKQPPQRTEFDKEGIFEMMPTKHQNGWIYSKSGMIAVSYYDNIKQIEAKNIFVGCPVIFCCVNNKTATNIRLQQTIRQTIVKNCITNKGKGVKTKCNAQYFIINTKLQFIGDITHNRFEVPKDCGHDNIRAIAEKTLNAFLNTEGGTLYIGVDKQYNIVGVKCHDIDISFIEKGILDMISTFTPYHKRNVIDKVKIITVPVLSTKGNLIDDLIVLKISIPGSIMDQNGKQIIFSTETGDKYKKNLSYIVKIV